jgi:beta-phosphoglucomutase-like phosphatase (HAD superfamily)
MKAFIFDLDGTLLDSMDVWGKIDVDFLQKRGIAVPSDYMDAISSMSFTECAVYTIERFNLPDSVDSLMREWTDMAAYAYGHTVLMKPYAKEYLSTLRERGAKLGIATSLSAELYEPALCGHGIYDWFNVICNSDDAGYGKSRPDVFLLAAKKLGVLPGDCVVFEDILAAVKTAKNAGMKVCGVYDKAAVNDWEQIKETADFAITDWRNAPLPE